MKLTLSNVKEIKRNSDSPLTKRVCNYVIGRWGDYNDKKYIFTDVLHNGCCSGVVSELIYYYDTVRFYKWDKEDPLAQDDFNQNLLAWFGFEETLRNIGYNFETLQNCI